MEKLQSHLTIARNIKGTVFICALKHKSLAVDIVHRAVQIRWTQNICFRYTLLQFLLRFNLIGSIRTPVGVHSRRLRL